MLYVITNFLFEMGPSPQVVWMAAWAMAYIKCGLSRFILYPQAPNFFPLPIYNRK